jgi:hypothetical protein
MRKIKRIEKEIRNKHMMKINNPFLILVQTKTTNCNNNSKGYQKREIFLSLESNKNNFKVLKNKMHF